MSIEPKERRLSVLAIAAGSTLGMLGVSLGVIWLASLWGLVGAPWAIFLHPDLMILGFLQLFILGVGSLLIPRFKNRRIASPRLGYLSVGLIVTGGLLPFFPGPLHLLSTSLMLVGSLIFSLMLMASLGRPSSRFAAADYYLHLGLSILVVIAFLKVLNSIGLSPSPRGYWDAGLLLISLAGFPIAMIAGIMTRTIHFRIAVIRHRLSISSFIIYIMVISLAIMELAGSIQPTWIMSAPLLILWALWAVSFSLSIELFRKDSGEQFSRMNERDRARYLYFVSVIRLAGVWLLVSAGLAVAFAYASLTDSSLLFGLRDSFIHALSLGFIGHIIMGYGPIMLPGLLMRRMPYIGLTLTPPYLLTAGTIWRVIGMILDPFAGYSLWTTALSGIVIVVAIIHFLLMTHRLRP